MTVRLRSRYSTTTKQACSLPSPIPVLAPRQLLCPIKQFLKQTQSFRQSLQHQNLHPGVHWGDFNLTLQGGWREQTLQPDSLGPSFSWPGWFGASYLTSMRFCFFIYKESKMTIPISLVKWRRMNERIYVNVLLE